MESGPSTGPEYDTAQARLKAFGATAPLKAVDGRLSLRVLLDRTSIELFANCGELHVSRVFFADPADRTVALTAQGGPVKIHRLVVRELRSVFGGAEAPKR